MDQLLTKRVQRARLLFLHIEVFLLEHDYDIATLTTLGLYNILKISDLD